MAAGGSLSRSERKAAARAEILQQEEQRDRRRQVRYGRRPSRPRFAAAGRRDQACAPGRCPASGGNRRRSGAPRSARC